MIEEYQRPDVVEAEIVEAEPVDLDALLNPNPPPHLPAVRQTCACGKNGTAAAHGAVFIGGRMVRAPFSCGEVLAIAARVNADLGRSPRARLASLFRRSGGA